MTTFCLTCGHTEGQCVCCERCRKEPVGDADPYGEHCDACYVIVEENRAEAAYEASLGECFRGNEAQAFMLEQLREMRKLK